MKRRVAAALAVGVFLTLWTVFAADEQPGTVRITAPISTQPYLVALAASIRKDKGLTLIVTPKLTSADALGALVQRDADMAVMTRPLKGEDRALDPGSDLVETAVGMQVVGFGVADDVWDANVRSLTRQTIKDIYEGKIKNWHEIGGPDEAITMFNVPEGEGIWEIFAQWLYGDNLKAPLPKGERARTSEDARDHVEFTPGAIAVMAAGNIEGGGCHAVSVEDPPGHKTNATPGDVASGAYAIVRPINAMTEGKPALDTRTVIEYMVSPSGQALLKKIGALGKDAAPTPTPNPFDQTY